ncbi:50S ribosomal protein L7/L12 [Marinobacter lipolyticus SM19]|uniref:50S ribosomal protein L7/L12 n=1 Tax=Marinobacter lipolyticus SM19 TaxID=1318628 RepID=R8AW80_9GAMM|nr:50S ribosomal protein L7/L12 [Marinobacter lipolyticus SM19]
MLNARFRSTADSYLSSTEAPASSSFFLASSASSLLAASLITEGALSTISLASFRPRPVSSRTALITFTFFSPGPVSTTSNSVCSSAAASPPAATGAAATAAAADTPNFSSIASTSATTSITLISAIAFKMSSLDRAMTFSQKYKKWCSTESSSFLLLVANCRYSTSHFRRNFVQCTCQLGDRCLCYCSQHSQRFVTRWQLGQAINLVCTHQLTADGQALDLKCLFLFGKILEQACCRTRIFHRERQNGRANQGLINALELSTANRNLCQVVTNNLQMHAFSTSLGTKSRHITRGDTTVVSQNHRQSTTGSLVDFSDDRFLVFESNCHWISPRFRRGYSRQTHHCP